MNNKTVFGRSEDYDHGFLLGLGITCFLFTFLMAFASGTWTIAMTITIIASAITIYGSVFYDDKTSNNQPAMENTDD